MKGQREKILFLVISILLVSAFAYASWTSVLSWGAKTTVSSSKGMISYGADYALTRATAGEIIDVALAGGSTVCFSEVVGIGLTVYGAYYLATNIGPLVDWIRNQAGVSTGPSPENGAIKFTLPSGKYVKVWCDNYDRYNWVYPSAGCILTGTTNNPILTVTAPDEVYHNQNVGGYRWWFALYNVDNTGNGTAQSLYPIQQGASPTIVDQCTDDQNYVESPAPTINPTIVASTIDSNPSKFVDPSMVSTTLTTIKPTGTPTPQNLGPVTGTQSTGVKTNPTTGQTTDPVTGMPINVQTSAGPTSGQSNDQMTTPGWPDVPSFDASITPPVNKDIPGLLNGWFSAAPFMTIINNFHVIGSAEVSSFVIPTPFGGSGTIDFGQFASLWAAISTLVISFSYIYGIMILFGKG